MNTNSTRPMANNACRCKPDAYDISMAMPVVRNRTVPSRVGRFATFPATIMTAIVSPMARPTPKITPDKIPERAAGMVMWKMVCVAVAPSPSEASRYDAGTARRDCSVTFTMVGIIMTAKIRMAAKRLSPMVAPPNTARIAGTITSIPKKP